MAHVVLTRFNLPSPGRERSIRDRPGWLESRVELFERFCLPSAAAQTDAAFHWMIYFDPGSPTWLRERIDRHAAEGRYAPRFREEVPADRLLHDIREVVGGTPEDLLTTNLDNDDALATDFCARLRAQPRPGSATAYFFVNGLVRTADALYVQHDRANAFPSVRSSWEEGRTCWSEWHTHLAQSMPVVELAGAPGWLQVVHDRNVSNRIRGRRTAPAAHAGAFPGLLDDLPDPSPSDLRRDRFLDRPVRQARDGAVRVLKPAVLRVLGRAGPDRVRQVAARLRRS